MWRWRLPWWEVICKEYDIVRLSSGMSGCYVRMNGLCSSGTGYCGMCDCSTAKLLFSVWEYETIRIKEDG